MLKSIQVAIVVMVAAAFTLGITQCGESHTHIDAGQPSRWSEYATFLEREVGPLEYIGGMQSAFGGCDLYRTRAGEWWLIGPGRRWTKCTRATAQEVSDRLIYEEALRVEAEPE